MKELPITGAILALALTSGCNYEQEVQINDVLGPSLKKLLKEECRSVTIYQQDADNIGVTLECAGKDNNLKYLSCHEFNLTLDCTTDKFTLPHKSQKFLL